MEILKQVQIVLTYVSCQIFHLLNEKLKKYPLKTILSLVHLLLLYLNLLLLHNLH